MSEWFVVTDDGEVPGVQSPVCCDVKILTAELSRKIFDSIYILIAERSILCDLSQAHLSIKLQHAWFLRYKKFDALFIEYLLSNRTTGKGWKICIYSEKPDFVRHYFRVRRRVSQGTEERV